MPLPKDCEVTAFGIFNLVSGGFALLASVIAGFLWNIYGASATFAAGAAFSTVTFIGLLFIRKAGRRMSEIRPTE
jgi:hypothetical protein